MSWHLDLSGLFVIVYASRPTVDEEVIDALSDLGVSVEVRGPLGICFPVARLRALSALRHDIEVACTPEMQALWHLVRYPASPNMPATVVRFDDERLLLEWENAGQSYAEYLHVEQVLALLAAEIPFVATAEAWALIDASTRSGTVVGRVALNVDGFLEISTARPQIVESLPLPGLFRIDATHFGLPLASSTSIDLAPGLLSAPLPPLELPPPPASSLELSGHHRADLEDIAVALCAYQSRVINWESGLGRRVFALAALDRIDAWPALIITPAAQLWAWQRHLDLIGRTYSLLHDQADAQLVTYAQLRRRRNIAPTPAIIFDQLTGNEAQSVRPALLRTTSLRDTIRIAVENTWPEELEAQIAALEILRPREFDSSVPISVRYPPNAKTRAEEHVGFYLATRRHADSDTDPRPFRRSTTRVVYLSSEHHQAIARASSQLIGAAAPEALAQLLDVVTAGPRSLLSPKVTAAAHLARTEAASGRSCAVLTRSKSAATLLRQLARPTPVTTQSSAQEAHAVRGTITIITFSLTWPDLRDFDHVIVLDYPWSLATIEEAVGPASAPGTDLVTVIHAPNTYDDALAVFASLRRESADFKDSLAPPSIDEIAYLLTPGH